MHYLRLTSISFAVALGLTAPRAARASSPGAPVPRTAADRAAVAEALFDQGKRLMNAGRFAEACAKFAESERFDHGVGTLLNLADCYEQNGQTASAWAEFRAAAAAASAAGQTERERIARERERSLEPLLAKLTVVIRREVAVPGLVVKRDDMVLDKSLWGVPIPVDPGDHTLEASAPGKRSYARTIKVPKRGGAWVTATVPALDDLPGALATRAAEPSAPPAPQPGPSGMAIAGLALGGLGVAGVVVGSALGLRAIARNGDSAAHCRGDLCDAEGVGIRRDALGAGTASTVAFVAAGVAFAAGATLYFTAPHRPWITASTTVGVSPAGSGLFLGATW